MPVSTSIISKSTNLMYLQTKCNLCFVMERRYSNNLGGTSQHGGGRRRATIWFASIGEMTLKQSLSKHCGMLGSGVSFAMMM
jgi:hypothetical protein